MNFQVMVIGYFTMLSKKYGNLQNSFKDFDCIAPNSGVELRIFWTSNQFCLESPDRKRVPKHNLTCSTYFSEKLKEDVTFKFTYYFEGFGLANTEEYIEVVKPLLTVTVPANTTEVNVTLTATHVGRVAIGLSSSDGQLERCRFGKDLPFKNTIFLNTYLCPEH